MQLPPTSFFAASRGDDDTLVVEEEGERIEVDMDCIVCGGKGCGLCKRTGWLEILGAGMVHPTVLRNGGYDPAKVTGFAFGMGPQRMLMLKHAIDDIRLFWQNDLRFLKQF